MLQRERNIYTSMYLHLFNFRAIIWITKLFNVKQKTMQSLQNAYKILIIMCKVQFFSFNLQGNCKIKWSKHKNVSFYCNEITPFIK